MADEAVVAKEVLTDGMIRAGEQLIRILDSQRWPVSASMWFYFPEENRWKLLIASPVAEDEGTRKAYMDLQKALEQLQPGELELEDIVVLDEHHPLIALLQKAIQTDGGIAHIRLTKNAVNGHLIEDAYIYRLIPSSTPQQD